MHARLRGLPAIVERLTGPFLAATVLAATLFAAPHLVSAAEDDTPVPAEVPAEVAPALSSSWPADKAMLWVPPKEGRLAFTVPVKASTLEVTLRRVDGTRILDASVDRLTSGEAVTEILLRLPKILPGMHEMAWNVDAASGETLTGVIGFGLEAPIAAVGGQNHRHGESHLYEDTPGQFAIRILFVLSAAFLLAGVRRSRSRPIPVAMEKFLVRVGAAFLLLASAVAAVVDAVAWVDEYHDKPFSALAAAPGLSLLLPAAGFAVFLLITARSSSVVAVGAAAVLAGYAGLSHAVRTALGAQLFVTFTVLLVALAALWGEAFRSLLAPATSDRRPQSFLRFVVVLIASSLLMLLLHAATFDLQMAFARDLRSRLLLAGAVAVSSALFSFFSSSRRRGVAAVLLLVLVAASSLLAWMPPPAAGL